MTRACRIIIIIIIMIATLLLKVVEYTFNDYYAHDAHQWNGINFWFSAQEWFFFHTLTIEIDAFKGLSNFSASTNITNDENLCLPMFRFDQIIYTISRRYRYPPSMEKS